MDGVRFDTLARALGASRSAYCRCWVWGTPLGRPPPKRIRRKASDVRPKRRSATGSAFRRTTAARTPTARRVMSATGEPVACRTVSWTVRPSTAAATAAAACAALARAHATQMDNASVRVSRSAPAACAVPRTRSASPAMRVARVPWGPITAISLSAARQNRASSAFARRPPTGQPALRSSSAPFARLPRIARRCSTGRPPSPACATRPVATARRRRIPGASSRGARTPSAVSTSGVPAAHTPLRGRVPHH
jgi:hypothetical protein